MTHTPERHNENPTERFSDRVSDYVKFRPNYPPELIESLKSRYGLKPEHVVVDVGSGTGISSEMFLKNGNAVFGVEPNVKMRTAGEEILKNYAKFKSVSGSSEATALPDQCADFIVAAQAFHWFEPVKTKAEFKRILKPGGRIFLIWNDRDETGTEFAVEYEALIAHFGTDYAKVNHRHVDEKRIRSFLGEFEDLHFYNAQKLDFASLLGRITSSSYMPNVGHPRFEEMKRALEALFKKYEKDGTVTIEYDTQVFASK